MTLDEQHDEQSPNYIRRRFLPCKCDPVRGEYDMRNCNCSYDEDGEPSHGGSPSENYDRQRGGYPRSA